MTRPLPAALAAALALAGAALAGPLEDLAALRDEIQQAPAGYDDAQAAALRGRAQRAVAAAARAGDDPRAAVQAARIAEGIGTALLHRHNRPSETKALWTLARSVYESKGGPAARPAVDALTRKLESVAKVAAAPMNVAADPGDRAWSTPDKVLAGAVVAVGFLALGLWVRGRAKTPLDLEVVDAEAQAGAQRALSLGLGLLRQGRTADAVKYLKKVAELESGLKARGRYYLAVAALHQGRPAEARTMIGGLDPTEIEADEAYVLADALEKRGDSSTATALFRKLFLQDAAFKDVEERLKALDQAANQLTEADVARMVSERVLDSRFQGVELLGFGGMGFVFRARDTKRDGLEVALKALSPFYANQKEVYERFLREAGALTDLVHPNVIRIYDVFEEQIPYYTMELVADRSLADVLAAEGILPPARAVHLGRQFCDGLAQAHARGIVHRDIKPGNILVDPDDQVKVIDFGVARMLDMSAITVTGQVLGTPVYMSPEQVRGQGVDQRSDIYSFGIVLYVMLSGVRPFESSMDHMLKPVPELPPDCPASPALRAVVTRCLQKAPEKRFQTIAEVEAALADCAAAPPATGAPA